MKRIYNYLKKDAVLTISWGLAIVSMFFIKPDKSYAGYIDWRSLGILWSLMIITKGYMQNGILKNRTCPSYKNTKNLAAYCSSCRTEFL